MNNMDYFDVINPSNIAGNIVVMIFITLLVFTFLIHKKPKKQALFFSGLYFYHLVFSIIFYNFTIMGEGNDSLNYYLWSLRMDGWGASFGLTRNFIIFIVYPFIHYLGASFFLVTLFFGTLGYIGIYLTVKGLIDRFGYKKGLVILLFLPGLHYWTSSISKESLVLFSLGLVLSQIIAVNPKISLILLGVSIATIVRPYAGVIIGFSLAVTYLFNNKKIPLMKKALMGLVGGLISLVALNIFINQIEVNSINEVNEQISNRQESWVGGGSTINLTDYNPLERIFIFLFRPFFFDASTNMMLISSLENLILMVFSLVFLKRIVKSKSIKAFSGIIKFTSTYLIISIVVYSTVTANLGTAVRKKTTIIPAFIILYSLYSNRKIINRES